MPGHLERRAATSGGLAKGRTSVEAGQATSLTDLAFTEKALTYTDDIPRSFRAGVRASTELALRASQATRSGGELIHADSEPAIISPRSESDTRKVDRSAIASGVRQLDKPRKSSERVVQRRIGWQATPDRIVLTTAERELSKTSTGKFSPSGEWLIEDRRTYRDVNGKAAKRTGDVPVDTQQNASAGQDSSPASSSGTEASVAEQFPEGAQSLGLLPSAVRSSAIARVASPMQFDGVTTQWSEPDGTPASIEVNVLRMDAQRAVVIHATSALGSSSWSVSQATYRLSGAEIEQA